MRSASAQLGDFLEAGLGDELSIWAAPNAPAPGRRLGCARIEIPSGRPVRASQQRNLRPNTSTDASTLATLRSTRGRMHLVECHAVAAHVVSVSRRRQCSPRHSG